MFNKKWLNRNVTGAGLTSLLSDAGHEMATVILPGFLSILGAPPYALGFIEGISDSVSSTAKLFGGWISDKFGHRKFLTATGYFITGLSMAIFSVAKTWNIVLFGRLFGWLGRGFRNPIRDAILAESVSSEDRGKAFGFHRAGDTIGAIIGPVISLILLSFWQPLYLSDPSKPFRNIFLVTLVPGLLSGITFVLFVKDKSKKVNKNIYFWKTVKELPSVFKKYLLGAGIFGLGDFAPTWLIYAAVFILSPVYGAMKAAQLASLMYIVRNITYALSSFPIGWLSDRMNRISVLVIGNIIAVITILIFAILLLFNSFNLILLFVLFGLAGIFIASVDTLESAITADLVNSEIIGSAMGLLGTVNGVGDLISSSLVGILWTFFSPAFSFIVPGCIMLAGTIVLVSIRKNNFV